MKTYTIRTLRYRSFAGDCVTHDHTGTLEELTQYFSYTLLKGHSWENEPRNRKINMHPKTIRSLVSNLNNAEYNASANGDPSISYEIV